MGRGEVGDKAYVVKLSTMGGGGSKSQKNGPHSLCTTPSLDDK